MACAAFAVVLHGGGRDRPWRWPRLARVPPLQPPSGTGYLGDAGAYLLGAVLAVLLARPGRPGTRPALGVACLALVAIPASEVGFAVVRRLRAPPVDHGRGPPPPLRSSRGSRLVALAAASAYIGGEAVLATLAVVACRADSRAGAVAVAVGSAVLVVVAAGVCGRSRPGPRPSA